MDGWIDYLWSGTLPSQSLNLAIPIDLVIFEHGQLGLLAFMLDLLGRRVDLLLALLATTPQPQHQMERRFFLDVIVG